MDRHWQNWDKPGVAQTIDEFWEAEDKFRETVVKEFESKKPPGNVLEVGCGSGRIYVKLAELGVVTPETYVGGDVSQAMLMIARRRARKVEFRTLDIFNLDIPDQSFDNVICIQVLQHLPTYKEAVKELVRVARKQVFIVTWLSDEGDKMALDVFYNNHWGITEFTQFAAGLPRVKCVEWFNLVPQVKFSYAVRVELE